MTVEGVSSRQTWKECVLKCNEDAVNREDVENRNRWRIGSMRNRPISTSVETLTNDPGCYRKHIPMPCFYKHASLIAIHGLLSCYFNCNLSTSAGH